MSNKLLYLPLDERFATRDTFLNLAQLTSYQIITPPQEMLSSQKQKANLNQLHQWIETKLPAVDCLLLSAEMFLYGGLIPSRISTEPLTELDKRLQKLVNYHKKYPDINIYLSTVIMRIPDYNLAVEEPDFWADWGADIFNYSYYQHKYDVKQAEKYRHQAEKYKTKIPANYFEEFIWRRNRNHQLTKNLLELQSKHNFCREIYITLDDNAAFGLNKQEEATIRQLVSDYSLSQEINIYPGADEVGLTMLARFITAQQNITPRFKLVYRQPASKQLIPNYEGQPLAETIADQIKGAGGQIVTEDPDITLLINNFVHKQKEAANQSSTADYEQLTTAVKKTDSLLGLADVRYSNGGDRSLLNWLTNQQLNLSEISYAGWNTAGNTLGTVISNTILLQLFKDYLANQQFTVLRLLEDLKYQAVIRPELINYVESTTDSVFDLSSDLNFYTAFVRKRLIYELTKLKQNYQLSYQLDQVFFPWQRTFEIGFTLQEG